MKNARWLPVFCLLAFAGGCSTFNKNTAEKAPPKTPKSVDADQFLAQWNANAAKVKSLRCDSVDIDGNSQGQLYSLSARLAYEQNNRVRLMGKSTIGEEIDFGSNDDRLWFWVRRMKPPGLYFCRRSDLGNVKLPTPFHPDWVVEALGVIPIDAATNRPGYSDANCFTLVSDKTTPSGQIVTKRIVVKRETNRVEFFELWDTQQNAQLLAKVHIMDYYDDPESGIFVPKKLSVEWPEAENTKLTLNLRPRRVQINRMGDTDSKKIFGFPEYVDTEVVDIAKLPGNESYGAKKPTNGPRQRQPGPFEPGGREIQPARNVELNGTIIGEPTSRAN